MEENREKLITEDENAIRPEEESRPETAQGVEEAETQKAAEPFAEDAETQKAAEPFAEDAETQKTTESSGKETETQTGAEASGEEAAPKKTRRKKTKKTDAGEEGAPEEDVLPKPDCPEAAIEAVLFATGNSVPIEQLSEILNMKPQEVREAVEHLKQQYDQENRGITLMELEDAVQLGTKGEYYEYLMKLAKHPKHYSLSDTVIETLSIIAYKQPVTRSEIEKIRGVSCDHAINKLLEYDLIEEVGRLDAPGKPLLFGTTEQFLRSFGVKSIGELPTVSAEMVEDFKVQAEAEAAEDLALENVKVDI